MKFLKINRFVLFILPFLVGLSYSCKDVVHEIDTPIVSINENAPSSAQVGTTLRIGFIANQVSQFDFSIVAGGSTVVSETVQVESGRFIVSREFDIPNDENLIGEGQLRLSYQSGGQTVEKTQDITFTESNPAFYLVGGSTGAGWEPNLAIPMRLYGEDSKTTFESFEYITVDGDGFKFLPTPDGWDGDLGMGDAEGTLAPGGGNVQVESDGFYRVRIDTEALTYELLETNWGVIGDATPGGWDADTDMTFEGGRGTYTWKVRINLVEGELKFRANDDWAINIGGTEANLTQDGPNIAIGSAGVYDIELHLNPSGFSAKITKN